MDHRIFSKTCTKKHKKIQILCVTPLCPEKHWSNLLVRDRSAPGSKDLPTVVKKVDSKICCACHFTDLDHRKSQTQKWIFLFKVTFLQKLNPSISAGLASLLENVAKIHLPGCDFGGSSQGVFVVVEPGLA